MSFTVSPEHSLVGPHAYMCLSQFLVSTGKFGTAASTGVVMPPKPQMIAKQDWRYVSGGGRVLRNAHEPSTEITSLAFASNGSSLVSRGADESLKVHNLFTPFTPQTPCPYPRHPAHTPDTLPCTYLLPVHLDFTCTSEYTAYVCAATVSN